MFWPRNGRVGELVAGGRRGVDAMIGIGRLGRLMLIGLPFLWPVLFFLLPLLIVLKISFADSVVGRPPYTPLLADTGNGIEFHATLANFAQLARDGLYLQAYLRS